MADDANLPVPGQVLAGKYQIERLIGRGGMGAVFAAQHLLLNQRVAIKLLLGDLARNSEVTARFMNEARAAARIQGEHVARVLDIGQLETGIPYMVMEYLDGSDLAYVLHARGKLSVAEVADYALQALDALSQAHAAGIVHRDLKPANLFLARRHDGTSLVKVLDFGISKNLQPGDGQPHGMTSTRAVLGSPEYMSPEQLRTPREVDTRTDIWSLGVILYELLTGSTPFKGESLAELFVAILETQPRPVRQVRPDVPPAMEAVVARCMMRDREQRFATVQELAGVLMVFASDQMRALAAARGSSFPAPAPGSLPQLVAAGRTANTAAPWANTGGGPGTQGGAEAKRSRNVGIIAASVLGLTVGIVGVGAIVKNMGAASAPDPAPSVPVAAAVTSAPPPSPSAPPQASAAPPAPPAVATPTKPAPPVKPTPPSPPRVDPASPAPVRPAPPPAPAPAKNCSPNYYFDKDGNKHFKPECF